MGKLFRLTSQHPRRERSLLQRFGKRCVLPSRTPEAIHLTRPGRRVFGLTSRQERYRPGWTRGGELISAVRVRRVSSPDGRDAVDRCPSHTPSDGAYDRLAAIGLRLQDHQTYRHEGIDDASAPVRHLDTRLITRGYETGRVACTQICRPFTDIRCTHFQRPAHESGLDMGCTIQSASPSWP